MPDQQNTFPVELARERVQDGTKPQNYVAPAFAAGRAMIKLAQQPAKLGLFRVQRGDACVGQPVQDTELFFAQPLVYNQGIFLVSQASRFQHEVGSFAGAKIRRGEDHRGALFRGKPSKPAAEGQRLALPQR